MEDPRCKSLFDGVVIEIEDPRYKGQFNGVVVEMEDPRCKSPFNSVEIEMEDPRCKSPLRMWGLRLKERDRPVRLVHVFNQRRPTSGGSCPCSAATDYSCEAVARSWFTASKRLRSSA